jgi:DNA-binding CsgD family transcriptional regulator
MADLELDLEAVLDALKLQRFILVGYFYSAHVAIRYAVKHPDRVRALVLVSCSVSMAAWPLNSLVLMADQNWEAFLHNWVPASFSPVERDELMSYFKMARTSSDWVISARAFSVSDVAGELSEVRTPTLVLHPRDFIWLRPEESTRVASSIDGARFVLLDGILPFGDASQAMTIIDTFIADLPEEPGQPPSDRGLSMVPDGLTPREVQVLKLLAAGMSNKEIAAELMLSPRTIERHVGSIYEKIGIRGRAGAATYAHTRLPV